MKTTPPTPFSIFFFKKKLNPILFLVISCSRKKGNAVNAECFCCDAISERRPANGNLLASWFILVKIEKKT